MVGSGRLHVPPSFSYTLCHLTSLHLFFQHFKFVSASGPLHFLFPSYLYMSWSFTILSFLLCHHILREVFSLHRDKT